MPTSSKSPPAVRIVPEPRRIAQMADQQPLSIAQRWFMRERAWINDQQLQLCRIPAPTFFEQPRAEWFRDRLNALGWEAKLDRAGNVLATRAPEGKFPALIVSAHLDTVIAPKKPEDIHFSPDGRLLGTGQFRQRGRADCAARPGARVGGEPGLVALNFISPAGCKRWGRRRRKLSGMRFLCKQTALLGNVRAFLVLDGPSTDHITAQALASRRFEISFAGPGGHSWNDYGTPNPVHAIGEVISTFAQSADARLGAEKRTRCSYNFGLVEGGTSVNSIPSSARAKLDLRSEDPQLLDEISGTLNHRS